MTSKFNHIFTDTIPDNIEEGKLYISLRFNVIIHLCACGCKNKVVTPLSPARWKMIYDGKTISLTPSIGNWNFECESHYWINNSEIEWARKWSDKEIEHGKFYERAKRSGYYKSINSSNVKQSSQKAENSNNNLKSIFLKIIKIFTGK